MLEHINDFLWSVPVLGLILGTGLCLTVRTRAVQVRFFPAAIREFFHRAGEGGSSYRALCTALAATVGTGNIAGVAGAIAIGGPGAVLWMWVSGFLGLAVKYAESTLATAHRRPDGSAGPMCYIPWKWLAWCYSLFGLLASFGVGNAAQVDAVVSSMEACAQVMGFSFSPGAALGMGGAMALVVVWMVRGGGKAVGAVSECLIPLVSGVYVLLCLGAIAMGWERLSAAAAAILRGALQPGAVTGGMVGSAMTTLRIGVSRGVFTNEAGMGTAAIAHGTAQVDHPARQGLMGMMEVFLDTMVICTLTALAILTSGIPVPYGTAAGAELTARALAVGFGPWITAVLCGCLCLFALATILGWGFYAGRCAEELFGRVDWNGFALLQGAGVLVGTVLESGAVWTLAELCNGLMAIPNLLAILALTPELVRLTGEGRCAIMAGRKNPKGGNTHERKGNRRAPSAHPSGPQQYDRHPRLLRQRGQGSDLQVSAQHRHDAGK